MNPARAPAPRRAATFAGRDPTQTTGIRRSYAAAARRRWRFVKGGVRDGVGGADALGIGEDPPGRPILLQAESPEVRETLNRLRRQIRELQRQASQTTGAARAELLEQARQAARAFISTPGRFAFPSDALKLEAFSGWLDEMTDTAVIEVVLDDAGEVAQQGRWLETYVRQSYERGVAQADARLQALGFDFEDVPLGGSAVLGGGVPFAASLHADALELLMTRNLDELRGITEATGQQIRRELAEGVVQGLNPRRMATLINRRVDAVGLARSRVLARTEVIRAHAEATLNRYEQHGVGAVAGRAEFSHAGDDHVCPICESLEGEVFPLDEARGVIPVHPLCRCTFLPVLESRGGQAPRSNAHRRMVLDELAAARRAAFPDWYRGVRRAA